MHYFASEAIHHAARHAELDGGARSSAVREGEDFRHFH